MHVFRTISGVALGLAALAIQPRPARAQYYQAWGPSAVRVYVHAGRGWMQLTANRQAFLVRADSTSLAAWADSAAALREPQSTARLAYYDSMLGSTQAMTFIRLSRDRTSRYAIAGEDGAYKGSIDLPFDTVQTLLAALRGVGAWRQLPTPPPGVAPTAPFFKFVRAAVPRPGQSAPQYPMDLRMQHVSGEVLAQFTVDSVGRVKMATFKVLRSANPEFVDAVRAALDGMRYFPAESDGHWVEELVMQPFSFNVQR